MAALTAAPSATWLVEVALKGDGPADWQIVSGYSSEEAARKEVRQTRSSRSRKGYAVRARLDA